VPVCNGIDVFARPAFRLDMRFWVTAKGAQQSMPQYHQHINVTFQRRYSTKISRNDNVSVRWRGAKMEGQRMQSKHECADASLLFASNQPRLH